MRPARKTTLAALEGYIRRQAALHDYAPLGPFAGRHGALELTLCQRASRQDPLNRYVTVSIWECPGSAEEEVALTAGADDGVRFVRHQVRQFRSKLGGEAIRRHLKSGIADAISLAGRLQAASLRNVYLPSRRRLAG